MLTNKRSGAEMSRTRSLAGEAFERELSSAFAYAAQSGAAWITKRPTPVRITSKRAGGIVTGKLTGSPGVDYVGVLRGGRAIYLEAKRCSDGVFRLAAILPEQWSEMARVAPLGAARVLVVRWQPDTDKGRALLGGRLVAICVVPWSECERARDAEESTLSAKTLAKYAHLSREHWTTHLAEVDPPQKTGS